MSRDTTVTWLIQRRVSKVSKGSAIIHSDLYRNVKIMRITIRIKIQRKYERIYGKRNEEPRLSRLICV